MQSYNESEKQALLRKELLRVSEQPYSLGFFKWIWQLGFQDLSNAFFMQLKGRDEERQFQKLGGMNWYFRAAFDETYEPDGYDVNSDEIVPVLDTLTLDSEEWVAHPDYKDHSKSTPIEKPKEPPPPIDCQPAKKKSQIELLIEKNREFDEYYDKHYSTESHSNYEIEAAVEDEISTVETLDRILTFFGFPSRRIRTEINYKFEKEDFLSEENKKISFYSIWPLLLSNWVGGWDNPSTISTEKQVWQWLTLVIKVGAILPFKLLTLLPKFILNCVKLVTEFLPLVAMRFSAHLLGWAVIRSLDLKLRHFKLSDYIGWKEIGAFLLTKIVLFALKLFPLALYFIFRTIALIGRAITSPEKSARMAFRYGRMLKVSFLGQPPTYFISLIIGMIGASVSIAITVTAWSILFPVLFGALLTYSWNIARLIPLALTKAAALLNSFSLGNTLILFIHNAYLSLAPVLSTSFGSFTAYLSITLFGLHLTSSFIALFSFIGACTAVAAPILSRVADAFSNTWATWKNNGPFTYLINFTVRVISIFSFGEKDGLKKSHADDGKIPLVPTKTNTSNRERLDGECDPGAPSNVLYDLHQQTRSALMSSEDSSFGANLLARLAETPRESSSDSDDQRPPTIRLRKDTDPTNTVLGSNLFK